MFDFSDHSENVELFDLVNKNVIAKMKDESKGKIISEFVGLKPKIFSLIDLDNVNKNCC